VKPQWRLSSRKVRNSSSECFHFVSLTVEPRPDYNTLGKLWTSFTNTDQPKRPRTPQATTVAVPDTCRTMNGARF
jgi:hypothetical protein